MEVTYNKLLVKHRRGGNTEYKGENNPKKVKYSQVLFGMK